MTVMPEMRFICDRCSAHAILPMHNLPMPVRAAGPDDWLALVIGLDPSTPTRHLCTACSEKFFQFIGGRK
jgi:hypothetical protein